MSATQKLKGKNRKARQTPAIQPRVRTKAEKNSPLAMIPLTTGEFHFVADGIEDVRIVVDNCQNQQEALRKAAGMLTEVKKLNYEFRTRREQ